MKLPAAPCAVSDVRVSRGVKRLPLMLAAGLLGAALSAAQASRIPSMPSTGRASRRMTPCSATAS